MRFALDSNVIIYAEGLNDEWRRDRAADLLEAIDVSDVVIPLQAAGEVLLALVSRAGIARAVAMRRIRRWVEEYRTQETDIAVFTGAMEIVEHHSLRIWDSIILSAAQEGGASILLSEDMQDGFKWRGVTVVNPFTEHPAPIVRDLLNKR